LAISDSSGRVLEERQFGAWGEVDFFKTSTGSVFTNEEANKAFSESILPRGFTGHEHFSEIALIHMNGRMYDPQLRRFLSPDNFIQDPYDTRGYDRFGYVWQNPLMNSDPSGELLETAFVALQLVRFISAGLNLYNLGNNIFGGFNNQFTYGPTGSPQVMNTNSNFNQFLNGSNKIDGVYLSSTNSIQDSIVRQDQNTFLDGPPKYVELTPQNPLKGVNLEASDAGEVLSYTAGAIGVTQIGMLEYRKTLSPLQKTGTFGKFASTYQGLGATSRLLGRASIAVSPLAVYGDYQAMQTGTITPERLAYRTGSLATALGIGFAFGSLPGAIVGSVFSLAEYSYDTAIKPLTKEINYHFSRFTNALKNGWRPQ